MSGFLAQKRLFELLRSKFPINSHLVDELARLLSISPSSVYRRINGDQTLSLREVVRIAQRYELSLDAIIHGTDGPIPCQYSPISHSIQRFEEFIDYMHKEVLALPRTNGLQLFIAVQDLPSFIYFGYPELLAFKKYVYGLSILENGQFRDTPFRPRLISKEAETRARACADRYLQTATTDIWGPNILDTTLRQITYLAKAGRFEDRAHAYLLCDQLAAIVESTRDMAARGEKRGERTPAPSFELYINDLLFTTNVVLVKRGRSLQLFATLGNPSVLSSSHPRLGKHMLEWFERLTRKSVSISVHGDRERQSYFNQLHDKVERTRARLFR